MMGDPFDSTRPGTLMLPSRAGSVDPVARILALSADCERAGRVGRALLAHGRRKDTRYLLCSILGVSWRSVLGTSDDDALRRHLDARRCEDFATGRVTQLDGWLLAQSEADFCILATFA